MGSTFAVDDVTAATEPLATRRFGDVLGEGVCVGADEEALVVDLPGVNPLLGAVHLAFSEHRPLVLSPDAIWLTIAQGVAQHVRLNAEALRPRLVRHEGREPITVTWRGALPTHRDAWRDIIDGFRAQVAEHTGQGLARLFTCDFSTSSKVDRVASEIVLMDAVSPYFDFFVACVCGIPRVTLTGTPADWRKIRERIDVIEELDLKEWARSLKPIGDELVRASEGHADIATWQRIYKPRQAYGWDRVTGWIARLFPYLKSKGSVSTPNPLLALDFSEPNDGNEEEWYDGPGIALDDAPSGSSSVLVRVKDDVRGVKEELEAHGGLMGIEQDTDGALRPISAYVIRRREAGILDVIDCILRDHEHAPDPPLRENQLLDGTAEQIALMERVGTALLRFSDERTWRIRGWREREAIAVERSDGSTELIARWIDLPNGQFLAFAFTQEGFAYLLCDEQFLAPPGPESTIRVFPETRDSSQPWADLPNLGSSLAAILRHALDHDGGLRPAT